MQSVLAFLIAAVPLFQAPPQAAKVYLETEVDKPAIPQTPVMPRPTLEAGKVLSLTVTFVVTAEGAVEDAKIKVSAAPDVDAMVLDAIGKWKYEPAQKKGKAVAVRVMRKYTFGRAPKS